MAVLQREENKTVIRMLTQREIKDLISEFERSEAEAEKLRVKAEKEAKKKSSWMEWSAFVFVFI